MAAVRLLNGAYREVWQETNPANFDGGTAVTITTGLPILVATERSKCRAELHMTSVTGCPVASTPTFGMVGNFLTVSFSNTAPAGNQAAYWIEILWIHSIQQATDPAYTGLGIVAATADGGTTPPVATFEFYVDGTAGSDAAAGTSRATAWKTINHATQQVESLVARGWSDVDTYLYVRGAFSNETMRLAARLTGRSNVHIVHHIDDWTETDTGTVATVAATVREHGLYEMTFTTYAPAAGDVGRLMVLTRGTNRLVVQILRVNGGTVNVSLDTTTGVPAWLVGGDVVACSVRQPSVSGLDGVFLTIESLAGQIAPPETASKSTVFGLVAGVLMIEGSSGIAVAGCTGTDATWPVRVSRSSNADLMLWTSQISATAAQNLGLLGTNTADVAVCGNNVQTGEVIFKGCTECYYAGYGIRVSFFTCAHAGLWMANVARLTVFGGTTLSGGQMSVAGHSIIRTDGLYGVLAEYHGDTVLDWISFLDVPVGGCVDGLMQAETWSILQIGSHVEGHNPVGPAVKLIIKGHVFWVACDNKLSGGNCDVNASESRVEMWGAWNIGSRSGLEPDIFLDNSELRLGGNFTKTAINAAGGGVANSVIVARNHSVITQLETASFTLPAATANWTTDYGGAGALFLGQLVQARLGTLTGGAGGATNVGCTLAIQSSLTHRGAGLTGVGPLSLGGTGAIPWPAAYTSDLAAGVPQNCWVFPGV